MKITRSHFLVIFVLTLALATFACSALSSEEPTLPPPPTLEVIPTEPPPTSPPEPTATQPEPTPPPAKPTEPIEEEGIYVNTVSGFYDSNDNLVVVGLVTNNTDRAVDYVELEIEALDTNEAVIYTDTTYADVNSLAPGETSSFSMNTYEDLATADQVTAIVIANGATELDRAELEVRGVRVAVDDWGYGYLTGELVNNTGEAVLLNSLAGAFWDVNDELITADSYSVSMRYFDPGAIGPFRINLDWPKDESIEEVTYSMYIDAEFTDPEDFLPLTISDTFNVYTDYWDSLHLVGDITNEGDEHWSVSLIAGIYNAEGDVLDAAEVSLDVSQLPPGEMLPFDFDWWGPIGGVEGMVDEAVRFVVQVERYWTWTTETRYKSIGTEDDAVDFDGSEYTFTGQLVNDTDGTLEGTIVLIYLVDNATDQVLAMGSDWEYDEMAVGSKLAYEISIDVEDGFDDSNVTMVTISLGELP
jgi:hypothetical protein